MQSLMQAAVAFVTYTLEKKEEVRYNELSLRSNVEIAGVGNISRVSLVRLRWKVIVWIPLINSHLTSRRSGTLLEEDVGKGDSFLFVIEYYNNLRNAHQYR
jgi:hypothetical protein